MGDEFRCADSLLRMIVAAAFCPHPPVLVPDVAQRAAYELDDVRSACRAAIARIAAPGRQLVLIGTGHTSRTHSSLARGTLAGYGVPVDLALGQTSPTGPLELPLSLTVGAWLVRAALGPDSRAIGVSVGPDWDDAWDHEFTRLTTEHGEVALVVMGDGSARRSTTAPGYLDERAGEFDAEVARAMVSGTGAAFQPEHLDPGLGERLLAAGRAVWEVAGRALEGREYDAQLLYDSAPYGVGYFVAAWTARGW